jgi:hypothetical protein
MAILSGVKEVVKAQVARNITNSVTHGLTKVAGNLFGVDVNINVGSIGNTILPIWGGKYFTKNLDFPLGVENDDEQGHYIIFEIMKQRKAELKSLKREKTSANRPASSKTISDGYLLSGAVPKSTNVNSGSQVGDFFATNSYGDVWNLDFPDLVEIDDSVDGGDAWANVDNSGFDRDWPVSINQRVANSIQIRRQGTVRLDTAIALYMPPSVSVSYGANYNDTEIGSLAGGAANVIQAFMDARERGTLDSALRVATDVGMDQAREALRRGVVSVAQGIAPGAAALIAIESGKIITPHMELMFSGIGRRNFSYEFTFVPKSRQEADRIEEIIKSFKIHMHADFVGAEGSMREMEIPDFFNIKYMYKGNENTHLNRISTCVLTKMDVNYGADRFVAYEDGVPQTTKLNLSFTELEIITRDKIKEGY